ILYGGGLSDDDAGAPAAGQVKVNRTTGVMTFGDLVAAADKVTASYLVDKAKAVKVTLQLDQAKETYTVVDGQSLADKVNDPDSGSAWVTVIPPAEAHATELPNTSSPAGAQANFKGGDDGAAVTAVEYQS